ncbi:MAG: hypothetical protein ACYSSI_09890, partial [Planctomycetota bacterium]
MEIEIKKNRHVIVTALAAILLAFVGSCLWSYSGFGLGWELVLAFCCVVGATGVVLQGFFYQTLLEGLKTIRKSLEVGKLPNVRVKNNILAEQLSIAISKYFKDNTKYLSQSEEKVK